EACCVQPADRLGVALRVEPMGREGTAQHADRAQQAGDGDPAASLGTVEGGRRGSGHRRLGFCFCSVDIPAPGGRPAQAAPWPPRPGAGLETERPTRLTDPSILPSLAAAPGASDEIVLSVVVPVKNEADNVLPLIAEIRAALAQGPRYEILYVDDGSTDET